MTKALLTVMPTTSEQRAARAASKARYREKHAERIRAKRLAERAAANTMPTLSLVKWAQINSPTSVWAYAERVAA